MHGLTVRVTQAHGSTVRVTQVAGPSARCGAPRQRTGPPAPAVPLSLSGPVLGPRIRTPGSEGLGCGVTARIWQPLSMHRCSTWNTEALAHHPALFHVEHLRPSSEPHLYRKVPRGTPRPRQRPVRIRAQGLFGGSLFHVEHPFLEPSLGVRRGPPACRPRPPSRSSERSPSRPKLALDWVAIWWLNAPALSCTGRHSPCAAPVPEKVSERNARPGLRGRNEDGPRGSNHLHLQPEGWRRKDDHRHQPRRQPGLGRAPHAPGRHGPAGQRRQRPRPQARRNSRAPSTRRSSTAAP